MTKAEIKRRLIEIAFYTTPLKREREEIKKMNFEELLHRIEGAVTDGFAYEL